MPFDEGLAERVRDVLRDRKDISERKMFGGLTFMSRGHMFVGILGGTLMARVGPDRYADALRQPAARAMDFRDQVIFINKFANGATGDSHFDTT